MSFNILRYNSKMENTARHQYDMEAFYYIKICFVGSNFRAYTDNVLFPNL